MRTKLISLLALVFFACGSESAEPSEQSAALHAYPIAVHIDVHHVIGDGRPGTASDWNAIRSAVDDYERACGGGVFTRVEQAQPDALTIAVHGTSSAARIALRGLPPIAQQTDAQVARVWRDAADELAAFVPPHCAGAL